MTNELIERLSNPSWSDCSCHHIMAEAAAEIERLRDALEEIRDYPNHIPLGIAKMRDIARAALKGQP
jgi:hypothetical protein